jgi:hypothetical protein
MPKENQFNSIKRNNLHSRSPYTKGNKEIKHPTLTEQKKKRNQFQTKNERVKNFLL